MTIMKIETTMKEEKNIISLKLINTTPPLSLSLSLSQQTSLSLPLSLSIYLSMCVDNFDNIPIYLSISVRW